MIDDDDLRTRLREPLGKIPLPTLNLQPTLRRGRRLRARRTLGAVISATLLAASVIVPLVVLSAVHGNAPPRPGASGVVDRFGISMSLLPGWDGRIDQQGDARFVEAANFALAPSYAAVLDQRPHLSSSDVLILMQENPDCPCANYQPTEAPIQIRDDDLMDSFEGVDPSHAFYNRSMVLSGRWFSLWVEFGSKPVPAEQFSQANAALAALHVEPESGWSAHVDSGDALSIQTPSAWTFHEDPVPNLAAPRIVFAAGTWPFSDGGDCGPDAALSELPSDGAFLWLTEFRQPESFADFRPRPATFELEGEPRMLECAGVPQYLDRFRDGWRYFQFQVAFGSEAPAALRQNAVDVMNSLVLGKLAPDEVEQRYAYICNHLPWIDCPFADWVRNTIWNAGYLVRGTTDVQIVGVADAREFTMWTTDHPPSMPGSTRLLDIGGTGVFVSDSTAWWSVRGESVWLGPTPDQSTLALTDAEISTIVRASLRTPFDSG